MAAHTLTVAGTDLCRAYGLTLTGFESSPPEPKASYIDIPGGDGTVDATEAVSGDVAYSDREMSFDLAAVGGPAAFEAAKSSLAAFLHGRRLDFQLSWDPGYTYTGRLSIDECATEPGMGTMRLKAACRPYKLKEKKTVYVDAAGGAAASLPCGRQRQCPEVSCAREFTVEQGGRSARLQAGTWRVPWLWLSQGENEVWCDSAPGQGDRTVDEALGSGTLSAALGTSRVADLLWKSKPAASEAGRVWFEYEIREL